ncbi:MAG: hypothetical protein H6779_03200 [Candidatus Nomurabacteria bacterium]|nr:MAG: hypothetical protein H6779_03200 [Candidatus Nomurabacteria bacterium]
MFGLFKKETVLKTYTNCPYCNTDVSNPTRKKKCPKCGEDIYARTLVSGEKKWVKKSDLPFIMHEWALKNNGQDYEGSLHEARNNIRHMSQSGVVKSVRLFTAEDEYVCDICKEMSQKAYPFSTPKEISFVMNNAHIRDCKSKHCRCFWKPEDISIE